MKLAIIQRSPVALSIANLCRMTASKRILRACRAGSRYRTVMGRFDACPSKRCVSLWNWPHATSHDHHSDACQRHPLLAHAGFVATSLSATTGEAQADRPRTSQPGGRNNSADCRQLPRGADRAGAAGRDAASAGVGSAFSTIASSSAGMREPSGPYHSLTCSQAAVRAVAELAVSASLWNCRS